MIMKCQPVLPAAAVNTSICSNSVSGRGSCREANASGPSGIEAPRENRRARLPNSASTNGNSRTSCRPGGCALVSMNLLLSWLPDSSCHGRGRKATDVTCGSMLSCRLSFWGGGMWCLYSIAGANLKVKDRISIRGSEPPITDQERRDQSAGERESGRDEHHGAEPGDEGLVYGTLDVRLRPCVHTLRGLRRPEMGLLRLHFAANLL